MKIEYLLPCSCGEKLVVDRSQAGLSKSCSCGKEVVVPTLRGLEQLERAAPAEEHVPQREWGARQAVLFLGAVITGFALLAAGLLWLTRPVFPQAYRDAMIQEAGSTFDLDEMTIYRTFELWRDLQNPDFATLPEFAAMVNGYEQAQAVFRDRLAFAGGATVVGLMILGVGFTLRSKSTPRG